MTRSRRFLPVVLPVVLAACGGSGTTPAELGATAPRDARLLARVPENALFVARLDFEALRGTTVYEAAASMPGASLEAIEGLAKIDRVLVSFGPMAEANAAFEPESAPAPADGELGLDPETPSPGPNVFQAADAAALDFWQRIFGRNLPGFVVLVDPHPGSDACEVPFRDQVTRDEGGLVVTESRGIAVFRTPDGLCGFTLPSLLPAVRAAQGMRSPAVARLLAADASAHGLGLLASATDGSGALLRGYVATASTDATPTEQRALTWLSRVSTAWNRGIEGSTSVVALTDGSFVIDTRYAYEDERRASAHEVIADTMRELADATMEWLAAESGGSVPAGVADRLRVERDGRELRVLWTLDEAHAAGLVEALLAPVRAGAEAAVGVAAAADTSSTDDWELASLPVDERIARIEPLVPQIDGQTDRAVAVDALAAAYAQRGRFDEAVALRRHLLDAYRASYRAEAVREAHEIARIAMLRGDYAEADRVLGNDVLGDGDDAHVSVDGVRIARLRGDVTTAAARIAELRGADYLDPEIARGLAVERALMLEARGLRREALAQLEATLDFGDSGTEASSHLALAYLEMLARDGRMADALGGVGERARNRAAVANIDPLVLAARTSLVICRAQRMLASDSRARERCTAAVEAAVAAYGEHHPDVAAARVELATVNVQSTPAQDAAEQLRLAEEALSACVASHPLRAEITRLRAGRRRPPR